MFLAALTFIAAGTMLGVPHSKDRAPQFGAGSIRRWAPAVLWSFGIDPYADLTEAVISTKPANWNGSEEQVSSVKGARLNDANFRYAQAYRVFLANAHLLHAKFQGAFLSQADLRGADLGQSDLRYAILDQAQMNHANLDRAVLDGANLSRSDLRAANLSYASLGGAALVDARLEGATLYGAKLTSATMIRTNLEKADLRESYLSDANLEHADMQGAYLWSAKLPSAHLNNAQLGTAIFVDADLRGADLRWAQLPGTVLTGGRSHRRVSRWRRLSRRRRIWRKPDLLREIAQRAPAGRCHASAGHRAMRHRKLKSGTDLASGLNEADTPPPSSLSPMPNAVVSAFHPVAHRIRTRLSGCGCFTRSQSISTSALAAPFPIR